MRKWLLVLLALCAVSGTARATIVTPEIIIVDPTADIQAAINALSANGGGTVQLDNGRYTLTSMLTIPHDVTLRGKGSRTVLYYDASPDSTIITITGGYAGVRDLAIWGGHSATNPLLPPYQGDVAAGTGVGILIAQPDIAHGGDYDACLGVVISGVYIFGTPSWCLKINGLNEGCAYVVTPTIEDCTFAFAADSGLVDMEPGTSNPILSRVTTNGYGYGYYTSGADPGSDPAIVRGAVHLNGVGAAVITNCTFQTPVVSASHADGVMLSFRSCATPRVLGSYFEILDAAAKRANPFITSCSIYSGAVTDCYFTSPIGKVVVAIGSFHSAADTVSLLNPADALLIKPGMLVYPSSAFSDSSYVYAVNPTTDKVTVYKGGAASNALSSSTGLDTLYFGYPAEVRFIETPADNNVGSGWAFKNDQAFTEGVYFDQTGISGPTLPLSNATYGWLNSEFARIERNDFIFASGKDGAFQHPITIENCAVHNIGSGGVRGVSFPAATSPGWGVFLHGNVTLHDPVSGLNSIPLSDGAAGMNRLSLYAYGSPGMYVYRYGDAEGTSGIYVQGFDGGWHRITQAGD